MKNCFFPAMLVFVAVMLSYELKGQASKMADGSDALTETAASFELPKIKVIPIRDTQSKRQYELYIKLPEAYAENDSTAFPVIYYTDAVWHLEVLSGTAEYVIEEAILVGISWQKNIDTQLLAEVGPHVSRYRDYSISPSSNAEHQTKYQFGQAEDHLEFVRNQVIPFVENNYRTAPDFRTYFGYSAGGLFGAYVLLAQPDTFKNYILGSPSLWRDNAKLAKLASQIDDGLHANVFLSYGSLEHELGPQVVQFRSMLEGLKDETLSLHSVVIEGSHQTAFPMTAVRGVYWLAGLRKNNL